MADVAATKEKVQAILTDVGPTSIDKDGDFSLQRGSTRVFVRVLAHPNGEVTIVRIFAPVVVGLAPTPEFYEWYAENASNWVFGHLALSRSGDGTMIVNMVHTLLGDYMDRDELIYAALGILGSADDLDDEVQKKFGGKLLSEL